MSAKPKGGDSQDKGRRRAKLPHIPELGLPVNTSICTGAGDGCTCRICHPDRMLPGRLANEKPPDYYEKDDKGPSK